MFTDAVCPDVQLLDGILPQGLSQVVVVIVPQANKYHYIYFNVHYTAICCLYYTNISPSILSCCCWP
jgi:hypothetical protein